MSRPIAFGTRWFACNMPASRPAAARTVILAPHLLPTISSSRHLWPPITVELVKRDVSHRNQYTRDLEERSPPFLFTHSEPPNRRFSVAKSVTTHIIRDDRTAKCINRGSKRLHRAQRGNRRPMFLLKGPVPGNEVSQQPSPFGFPLEAAAETLCWKQEK